MDFKKERAKKLSDAQKAALVTFVNRHPRILLSKFDADFRRSDAKKLWEKEAKVFNEIPGTTKTWKQWRKIWHDIKSKRPNHLYRYDVKYSNILKIRRANLKLSARKSEHLGGAQIQGPTYGSKGIYENRKHTEEQRRVLLSFLKTHPRLVTGQYDATFNCSDARKLWMEVTNVLNAMPGATKVWKQWRKLWHDLRIKFVDEDTKELAYESLGQYMDAMIEKNDHTNNSLPITLQDPMIQLPMSNIIKEEVDIEEPSGSHEQNTQETHGFQPAPVYQEMQQPNIPHIPHIPQYMEDDLSSHESPEDEDYKPYKPLKLPTVKQKVTKRVSPAQKTALLDFMMTHPKLSCGAIDLEFSPEDATREWLLLKNIMDTLPGARKNWIQWRQVWDDMKKKTNIGYANPQYENPIPITENFDDDISDDTDYDINGTLESQSLAKSQRLSSDAVEQTSGLVGEHQSSRLDAMFRLAEEVSGNSKTQAKAEMEYREQHLSFMKRQTEAIEAMVEYNRRQQWNFERQLEIQAEFTRTMAEILKKLSNHGET